MDTHAQPRTPPRCPRCGYDLRGAVATWAESCPLQGQCAECGLPLAWAELLRPEKFEPTWCVEFAPRRRVARAAGTTFLQSFRPWRFWSAIRMSMPMRPRRLLAYSLALLLLMLSAYAAAQGAAATRAWHLTQQSLQAERLMVQAKIASWRGTLAAGAAAADDAMQVFARQQVQMLTLQGQALSRMDRSWRQTILEALFLPWSRSPWVTMTAHGGARVLSARAMTTTVINLGMALWLCALLPASCMLLPVTLRRARVRGRHLVRIAAYGLFAPAAGIGAASLLAGLGLALGKAGPIWQAHHVLRFGIIIVVVAWWAAAIRRYLRMPHSLGVALLLSVLVGLAYVVLLWLLAPEALAWWLTPGL